MTVAAPSPPAGRGSIQRGTAPAKVNLTLRVLRPPRADGYHELRGVFARVTLRDELSVRLAGRSAHDAVDVLRPASPAVRVAADEDLALKAVASLRSWSARPLPPLAVAVRKRIPVAAGLAGGSSDAATALRLAAAAWELAIGPDELARIGLELGSDVPFFLGRSPIALVEGRGERVAALPAAAVAGTGVLLVCGDGKPSTGRVFAAFDSLSGQGAARERVAEDVTGDLVALLAGGAGPAALLELAPRLREANDLYPAAALVTPGLAGLRDLLEDGLGRPALLSGAGPTLFAFYASRAEAAAAGRALRPRLAAANRLARSARVIVSAIDEG